MPILRYFSKAVVSVFVASLALVVTPAVANAAPLLGNTPKPFPSISNSPIPSGEQRYIVKYDNNANAEVESESLKQKGIEVKDTFSNSIKASVVVASSQEAESLKSSKSVESVELDHRVSISGATSIWGLDRVDQRTGRDGQYNIGDEGSGVNIYVVDTGIYTAHTEFTGRITASWYGINDGNGVNDCNGHGTHVAGTAAGTTYGIAKKANIVPIRVLECDGTGWSSTVIAGMDWAISHHTAGQPAVMNMSIGGFTSASLDQAVRNVINDGITVVVAAGNSNEDACNTAPASVVPAITVAATDINDTQASFSNYGSCVDVQAPGVSIRSAYNNAPTGYNTMSGTSMASPHVAGAAAVMLSRDRSMTPAQVHQAIIANATVGVVNGSKGSTPNRLLFIPARSTVLDCGNLKMGDAWAGVGLTCGLGKTVAMGSSDYVSSPVAGSTTAVSAESMGSVASTPSVTPAETTPVPASGEVQVPAVAAQSSPLVSASVPGSIPVVPSKESGPAKSFGLYEVYIADLSTASADVTAVRSTTKEMTITGDALVSDDVVSTNITASKSLPQGSNWILTGMPAIIFLAILFILVRNRAKRLEQ